MYNPIFISNTKSKFFLTIRTIFMGSSKLYTRVGAFISLKSNIENEKELLAKSQLILIK